MCTWCQKEEKIRTFNSCSLNNAVLKYSQFNFTRKMDATLVNHPECWWLRLMAGSYRLSFKI
jgi:hypothetical protein